MHTYWWDVGCWSNVNFLQVGLVSHPHFISCCKCPTGHSNMLIPLLPLVHLTHPWGQRPLELVQGCYGLQAAQLLIWDSWCSHHWNRTQQVHFWWLHPRNSYTEVLSIMEITNWWKVLTDLKYKTISPMDTRDSLQLTWSKYSQSKSKT